MLRQHRLKKNSSFAYIYRKGEKVSANDMLLLFAKSREGLKIGLSVSKKIGNAVTRNRVKRLLREAIKPLEESVDQKYMYILVAFPSIVECDYTKILEEVKTVFQKAGKLC